MPRYKAVLDGHSLSAYGTDASARVRYYVDGVEEKNLKAIVVAKESVPFMIGQKFTTAVMGTGYRGLPDSNHYMRCFGIHPRNDTHNPAKYFVDVEFRSPPAPVVESSAAVIQRRTETYLAVNDNGRFTRKQIQLDYTDPSSKVKLPKRPAVVSGLTIGETLRFSFSVFADEVPTKLIVAARRGMAGRLNARWFYGAASRYWLCTQFASTTDDGGFHTRCVTEFAYNPETWDPLASYTLNGQPVIITPEAFEEVHKALDGADVPNTVPAPRIADGIGRFPQTAGQDFYAVLSQLTHDVRKYIPEYRNGE